MEPSSATWSFVRVMKTDRMTRDPLVVDALHALQSWRAGHPGRMFRFVRSTPFSTAQRLSARLQHPNDDELAAGELAHCCLEHKVQVSAVPPRESERNRI
jgi:hypothetical protein